MRRSGFHGELIAGLCLGVNFGCRCGCGDGRFARLTDRHKAGFRIDLGNCRVAACIGDLAAIRIARCRHGEGSTVGVFCDGVGRKTKVILNKGKIAKTADDEQRIAATGCFIEENARADLFNASVRMLVQDHEEAGVDALGDRHTDHDRNDELLPLTTFIVAHRTAELHGELNSVVLLSVNDDALFRLGKLECDGRLSISLVARGGNIECRAGHGDIVGNIPDLLWGRSVRFDLLFNLFGHSLFKLLYFFERAARRTTGVCKVGGHSRMKIRGVIFQDFLNVFDGIKGVGRSGIFDDAVELVIYGNRDFIKVKGFTEIRTFADAVFCNVIRDRTNAEVKLLGVSVLKQNRIVYLRNDHPALLVSNMERDITVCGG